MKFVPASDFVLNKIRLQDLLADKSIINIISSFVLQKYTDGKSSTPIESVYKTYCKKKESSTS